MLRAKDALVALPSSVGEDFEYNDDSNEDFQDAIELSLGGEGEGTSSSTVNLPACVSFQTTNASIINFEIQRQATALLFF